MHRDAYIEEVTPWKMQAKAQEAFALLLTQAITDAGISKEELGARLRTRGFACTDPTIDGALQSGRISPRFYEAILRVFDDYNKTAERKMNIAPLKAAYQSGPLNRGEISL
jgi:hypothetical protein